MSTNGAFKYYISTVSVVVGALAKILTLRRGLGGPCFASLYKVIYSIFIYLEVKKIESLIKF